MMIRRSPGLHGFDEAIVTTPGGCPNPRTRAAHGGPETAPTVSASRLAAVPSARATRVGRARSGTSTPSPLAAETGEPSGVDAVAFLCRRGADPPPSVWTPGSNPSAFCVPRVMSQGIYPRNRKVVGDGVEGHNVP
jgi:hypothetical protein